MVLAKAEIFRNIRLIYNPEKIVPAGMNVGIRAARGQYIIRMDAHAEYPAEYITNCLAELKRTGAGNVGGRLVTLPGSDTLMAKAISLFTQIPVGVGNSSYRLGHGDRDVDTVPFGAFPREVFERVGYYREDLIRNQDFELNARIRQAGYRIYLSNKIWMSYYNSGSYRKFMHQAWVNGIWSPRMWFGFPASFCWRHAAPLAFVSTLLSLFLVGLWSQFVLYVGMGLLGIYLAVTIATSIWVGARKDWKCAPYVALIMPSYHILYGLGTLYGLAVASCMNAMRQKIN